MRKVFTLLFSSFLLSACAVGPKYRRPAVQVPPQFRGVSNPEQAPAVSSLADLEWFDLFQDDELKQLVTTALQQNFDLRIAAERVLEARARLGVERSSQFGTLDADGRFIASRNSKTGQFKLPPASSILSDVSYTQAGFRLSWELDFWGRLRRLTEAARAEYLASEEGRRGVKTTLVSDVMTNYLELRELDLELAIALKNREIAQDNLRLTQIRRDRGAATGLDVRQAEQFLYTATAQIASAERSIGQTENALSLLLGQGPGDIRRGKVLEEFKAPPEVPAGLPSSLLERRPDIRQAEQLLMAANARIGAARAEYFPQISLTGFLGVQSRALSNILTGQARDQSIAPAVTLPVFNAGRIRSGVRLAEAQQREALVNYQKTIQTSLREVSDALIGHRKTSEQRAQQELLVGALRETERLASIRYAGGLDSYLQVLDALRNLFQGELALARLRQQELAAIVELYRALGGGWN